MSISKEPLGMNARNFLYISPYNKGFAKRLADNKLVTKRLLARNDISTSTMLKTFITRKSVKDYSWDLPASGFVLKPARGSRGEGILVFTKWENGVGTTASGKEYTIKHLRSHILDIFEGIYSLQSLPDVAYIEERITPSSFFLKLAPHGLADIRVIAFNKIPVMAMMRLPSHESNGKANLHQGALGIGIEMRTGITNHAIYKEKSIKFIPGTKNKTTGIKIPDWDDILLLASRAQDIIGLGYAGVDIVVDEKLGPLVLEINARPGLSIQNANMLSLRERLERVEALSVTSSARGVEIAKSIFAEDFSEKVNSEPKVLSLIEPITITSGNITRTYRAKLDTGAYRTSLDHSVIQEMNLPLVTETFNTVSASGEQIRNGVKINFTLAGKKISTVATVTNRSHLRFPIIIGRRDLKGFYVNPVVTPAKEEEIHEDTAESEEEIIE